MATSVQSGKQAPDRAVERFDAFVSYSHAADGLLAPRLQSALQSFAKPWWRRRALRVFRDEASLSANPHLWSSITAALDDSEWFVLLLSQDAAASPWVNREVSYWLQHKTADRILPVVTDGEFVWDSERGGIDARHTTSAPPSLVGAFAEEPRWIDLRWARGDTDLDLRNARYRAAVADLAAAIRGMPKDELESEEVRQHRRTMRTAWTAAALLALSTVAAVAAAGYAIDRSREAERQADRAEEQASIAMTNETRALAEAARADVEATNALVAQALARSRELAASAINVVDDDPELSILLALEAIAVAPDGADHPLESISALRQATHASKLRARHSVHDGGFVRVRLSPDGELVAVVSEFGRFLRVVDAEDWTTLWEFRDTETADTPYLATFSTDGALLALSIVDSTSHLVTERPADAPGSDDRPSRVLILDVSDGSLVHMIEMEGCPNAFVSEDGFSPDGQWLVVSASTVQGCDRAAALVRTSDWQTVATLSEPLVSLGSVEPSWSADSSLLSISPTYEKTETIVYDVASWEPVARVPQLLQAKFDPAGNRLFGIGAEVMLPLIFDLEAGIAVRQLSGIDDLPYQVKVLDGGERLMVGTWGRAVTVWNVARGEVVHSLSPTTATGALDYDPVRGVLYHGGADGAVTVWDLSNPSQGELATVSTNHWIQANSMAARGGTGVFTTIDLGPEAQSWVWAFDAETGELGPRLQSYLNTAAGVLPDGRVVAGLARGARDGEGSEYGPVVVWDPASGDQQELVGCWTNDEAFAAGLVGLAAPCVDRDGDFPWQSGAFLSPDQSKLMVFADHGELWMFDSADLTMLVHVGREEMGLDDVAVWMTPTGLGDDWLAVDVGSETRVLDTETWERVATLPVGITALSTNATLLAVVTAATIEIYDTEGWELLHTLRGYEGRVRGIEFSPDGEMLMTATTDGLVRVWDVAAGVETARVPLDGASDGHWIDDEHILVGTSTGVWTIITLDVDEMMTLARSRLTRDFTPDECEIYRIERCAALRP
jgi:WD40 repeat protein